MKQKVKKVILISIIAIACIILKNNEVNAYTGEATDESGITWNYTLQDEKTTNVCYKSGELGEKVIIPSELDGYPVESLYNEINGANIFDATAMKTTVKEIIIPNSVTTIGDYAFYNCSSLTSVEIPNSVTSIGSFAFSDCSSLTNIEIADSIVEIGYSALSGTAWYNRQPDGEVYINNILYSYKGNMPENTNIVIKEGTTSIVAQCFCYQYNLINVEIPDTVTYIGDRAFSDCDGLSSIEIPNTVTYMGESLFQFSNNLISVKLPDNLREIKDYSFSYCTKLQNINIPNTVISFGKNAFYGCSSLNLKQIIVSNPLEIKEGAFYGCSNIEEIQLLGGTLDIGENAFYSCIKLSNVIISELPKELYKNSSIGANAFTSCQSLVEITLPTNFSRIGSGAFSSCSNLEKVNILGTIDYIGAGAFYGTKVTSGNLEKHIKDKDIVSFIVEEGIGEIVDNTFLGAENLKSVHIPSTLYHISEKAFYGCNNLETITISQDNPYFTIEDGIIYNKNKTILIRCLPGKNTKVEIPNTVTEIEEYAFMGCSKLKGTLTVPGSVKKISEHAFERCTSKIPLVLEQGIESIEANAFSNSHFIGDLIIPDSVSRIEYEAFFNCDKFDGILKLGKVTYIASYAFANCSGFIGDLVIPEELSSINRGVFQNCTGFDGKVYIGQIAAKSLEEFAFLNCVEIKEIVGNISRLSPGAFANCISLINTGNYEGNGYASYAYYGCKSLKYINVNEMSGMYSTFDGATSLEEVKINEGVTKLCSGTFARCTSLKTVYISSTVTTIDENAFYGSDNIENIYVTQEKLNVNFDEILRKYCDNIHYLDDNMYTVEKNIPQNVEVIDVENSSEEGIKYGNTYKFKLQTIEGYEISDIVVKVKTADEEIELAGIETDGEVIYEIEDVKENIEIIVTAKVEEVKESNGKTDASNEKVTQ